MHCATRGDYLKGHKSSASFIKDKDLRIDVDDICHSEVALIVDGKVLQTTCTIRWDGLKRKQLRWLRRANKGCELGILLSKLGILLRELSVLLCICARSRCQFLPEQAHFLKQVCNILQLQCRVATVKHKLPIIVYVNRRISAGRRRGGRRRRRSTLSREKKKESEDERVHRVH